MMPFCRSMRTRAVVVGSSSIMGGSLVAITALRRLYHRGDGRAAPV
jgi:hypothetical protein